MYFMAKYKDGRDPVGIQITTSKLNEKISYRFNVLEFILL